MPSGRSHDIITLFLAVPVAAAAFAFTKSLPIAATIMASFLFGGLMFGPDLDTASRQYTRWQFLRFMWFPYRGFFGHRSRWTHGIVLAPAIRVVYFFGVVTLCAVAGAFIAAWSMSETTPDAVGLVRQWGSAGGAFRRTFGESALLIIFIGTWAGSVSHSLADIAVTYVRTGRVKISV